MIELNLERLRWMPRELGDRYILVNIPNYYLHAYDSGQRVLDMRVVVIEFPSVKEALAAHDSPAYQEALRVLGDAAERDMRVVEGVQ